MLTTHSNSSGTSDEVLTPLAIML